MLGANGAGKTTLLRAITGGSGGRADRVRRPGIISRRPDQIARLGIGHVPQGRGTLNRPVHGTTCSPARCCAGTARESTPTCGLPTAVPAAGASGSRASAASLSGGEQQMLAIARAMMGRPRLLLLDEPSLGLAPRVTAEVFAALRRLRAERGLTLLLVEQNARIALELVDDAAVVEAGRLTLRGPAAEIAGDDDVRRAYLGAD